LEIAALKQKIDLGANPRWKKSSARPIGANRARIAGELARLEATAIPASLQPSGEEIHAAETQERVKQIGHRLQVDRRVGQTRDFLTQDEIKNLTISKGTLTHEERDTINHHIVATIKMLEALPWPKHLENVPEYAGGHHEPWTERVTKALTASKCSGSEGHGDRRYFLKR